MVVDDDDTVYLYQLMAGAAINVTESLSLTAEYRFFDTITDAELTLSYAPGLVENSDIRSHEIRFGLRYWFFIDLSKKKDWDFRSPSPEIGGGTGT